MQVTKKELNDLKEKIIELKKAEPVSERTIRNRQDNNDVNNQEGNSKPKYFLRGVANR